MRSSTTGGKLTLGKTTVSLSNLNQESLDHDGGNGLALNFKVGKLFLGIGFYDIPTIPKSLLPFLPVRERSGKTLNFLKNNKVTLP